MIELIVEDEAVFMSAKAVPGASRTRHAWELDGQLKIAVAAPPQKGKANKAIILLMAEVLGVPGRDVTDVSGQTNPIRIIRIDQTTVGAVRAAVGSGRS